ncbi:MAG: hypothetical protein ACXAC2_00515 [Candidatus Kariarchaeaceae archaeon]|jgi:hypothetical protein
MSIDLNRLKTLRESYQAQSRVLERVGNTIHEILNEVGKELKDKLGLPVSMCSHWDYINFEEDIHIFDIPTGRFNVESFVKLINFDFYGYRFKDFNIEGDRIEIILKKPEVRKSDEPLRDFAQID